MEWRIDGGYNRRCEDEDLWRDPLFADGLQSRGQERKKGLHREDGLEEVGIEEVGEAGRRYGRDGRGLVMEAGYQDDRFERQLVRLHVGRRRLGRLEMLSKLLDSRAGSRGLGRER